MPEPPTIVLTQGDPAGIGPEIILRLLADPAPAPRPWRPLVVAERAAFDALRDVLPGAPWTRLAFLDPGYDPRALARLLADPERIAVVDPVAADGRRVAPGKPTADDARGALAALDAGARLIADGRADALLTAPLNKAEIARHLRPDFRGHTDYLARAAGLERYGRDYLMAFLAPGLRVTLLSTHLPLADAVRGVTRDAILDALRCLERHAGGGRVGAGRVAVAGLNPHAGEGGLMGREDEADVRPAVTAARAEGIDAHGPESPDSVFARARGGEFDWVLALYHDQGLIAVKTVAFGTATNLTLGLPYLRTSVDHGTAYPIAGRGVADAAPLAAALATTLDVLAARARA